MSEPLQPARPGLGSFRTRLLVAMMLVVTAVTALALFLVQRKVAADARRDLARQFESELAAFHTVQEIRHAVLAVRCRTLARRPRIHAALEDDALDLLYPSARDELADVMAPAPPESIEAPASAFHARFYRFLDGRGAVIAPPAGAETGPLNSREEAQLALSAVPDRGQTGYLPREAADLAGEVDEIIAMPILSSENGRPIAALVVGFRSAGLPGREAPTGMINGVWTQDKLFLPAVAAADRSRLSDQLAGALARAARAEQSLAVELSGAPGLLFWRRLNPGAGFPPAYEVCIYPLAESLARQRRLFWQFSGAGAGLLLGAFGASHYLSRRLSRPVERLAVDSEENRAQRQRAEAALELTHGELQRSARFSADASHQLKTPVTVLRAGLEELLAGEKLAPSAREEVAALVHQTFRLTSVIEDLLLLSRMDAGRLQLTLSAVDLRALLDGCLDDMGALPDGRELDLRTEVPPALLIQGERRYTTVILQNLLENARKYNRSGGTISVTARVEERGVILRIGNTGPGIPAAAQAEIFQRFHRGAVGENLPGHGLGLNLARELARLHGGDLRLVRSEADWTEFEVCFRAAGLPEAGQGRGA